jgi:hypothetical protein
MSEVQIPLTEPGQQVQSITLPATVQPAPQKLNAIQLIEQELVGFIKQREQAIANVHAVDGAIQAARHLLDKLKAEVVKAEQVVDNVIDFFKKEL